MLLYIKSGICKFLKAPHLSVHKTHIQRFGSAYQLEADGRKRRRNI